MSCLRCAELLLQSHLILHTNFYVQLNCKTLNIKSKDYEVLWMHIEV